MAAFTIFEIKSAKMDKMFNFLKDHFSVMSGPMDMIFGVGFMDGIFKSYNILNLKSCLKLNNP